MKSTWTWLTTCLFAGLLFSSCTKSDLPEAASGYSRVRLYDDTLPDPRNGSIRIAAGKGRLLMTYGTTPDRIVSLMGAAILFPPPQQNVWMLTDNDGNLVNRDTFPSGLSIADLLALPDNSFLIVTFTGVPDAWGLGVPWGLQFMRLDPNGVMGPADTLHIPVAGLPFVQIWQPRLYLTPGGNALIYFGYQLSDYSSGFFIGEMDVHGTFHWHKEWAASSLMSCVSTRDGGYMALNSVWDPVTQQSAMQLMKTNSVFDSTWTQMLAAEPGATGTHLAAADNGNFWIRYTAQHNGIDYPHVCKINGEGEIIDSVSYTLAAYLEPWKIKNVMLPNWPDGVFVTHSMNVANDEVPNRFNTTYVMLDANLNIMKKEIFQNQSSDMLNSGCVTSDGKIACFGIAQIFGHRYYKPELILFD